MYDNHFKSKLIRENTQSKRGSKSQEYSCFNSMNILGRGLYLPCPSIRIFNFTLTKVCCSVMDILLVLHYPFWCKHLSLSYTSVYARSLSPVWISPKSACDIVLYCPWGQENVIVNKHKVWSWEKHRHNYTPQYFHCGRTPCNINVQFSKIAP